MKLNSIYTLKQPLSHIGESEGTTTFLNTVRIVNGDKVEEVFAYTGNAIRGHLRDCSARHLLETLGIKVPKKEFNILFSGGNISGQMAVDVDQAKKYRDLLPSISLFGAGIGNQILSGKMAQSFALPVCKETAAILPDSIGDDLLERLGGLSWKTMTGTVSFSRMDDSKEDKLHRYMEGAEEEAKAKKKDGEASTQMRYEVEYLAPGSVLFHEMILQDPTELELGALVSALYAFSKCPVLGGMGGKGFGLVDLEMNWGGSLVTIKDGEFSCSDDFNGFAKAYMAHLLDNKDAIIELLGGVPL